MATTKHRTGSPVEVTFQIRDRECFFVEASRVADCRLSLEHLVNRSDGRLLEYFTIERATPGQILSMADSASGIDDARLVSQGADGSLFEFVVSGPCVTTTLADTGAIAQSVSAADGVGQVVASVPEHVSVRHVVETFCDEYSRTDLVARHDAEQNVPIRTKQGAKVELLADLTEKQLEVLQVAHLSGYFGWPRKTTAANCAEAIGIAQPTFSQHIRAAQRKVVSDLFDGFDLE